MQALKPMHHDYTDDFPISAGVSPLQHDPEAEREQLRREVELMMMEAEQLDELGPERLEDDPTVTNVAHELDLLGKTFLYDISFNHNLSLSSGLDAEDDDITIQDSFLKAIIHGKYAPYPNKLVGQFVIPKQLVIHCQY